MENINDIYKAELNFIEEFNLSRNGKVREIKTEFDIIRLCLQEMNELDEQYLPMLDRILVMPLRKLLCENNSVLLNVCTDFKMPRLDGFPIVIEDKQTIIRPPFKTENIDQWISVKDWLKQNISWFDRDANSIADYIPEYVYDCIINKLSGKRFKQYKPKFESLYYKKQVEYKSEIIEVYCKKNPSDVNSNQQIYNILDEIGYNKLSVYDFLKHMSDKRGAHIDIGHSLVVEMINNKNEAGFTPIHCFAVQMIYAAKKQIPELNDYWPEMPELII